MKPTDQNESHRLFVAFVAMRASDAPTQCQALIKFGKIYHHD